jgi:hypothetical protein
MRHTFPSRPATCAGVQVMVLLSVLMTVSGRPALAQSAPAEPTSEAVPEPAVPVPPTEVEQAPAQTRWAPFDQEVMRVADGSIRVCGSLALPLTIIPGVGEVVGTLSDWMCIVPAAMAVDYTSTWHGPRESHFWQPALALVLKKGFETLVDTPIIVVTIGAVVAIAVGSLAGVVIGGLPVSVVTAGGIGTTLVLYLGLRGVREAVGNFLFQKTFTSLVDESTEEATADERRNALLKPGLGGIPGAYGLMATVAGSRPAFDWSHAVPVMGPMWRAGAHAAELKAKTRRFAHEVMEVDKADLGAMDATIDALTTTQAIAMASSHIALGVGVGLFGAGTIMALTDTNNSLQATAEILGTVGLATVAAGGAAVVVSFAADRSQPLLVPLAWSMAP